MDPEEVVKGLRIPEGVEIIVFTDASGKSPSGEAGIGIVITTAEGHILHQESHAIEDASMTKSVTRLETFAAYIAMQRVPNEQILLVSDNDSVVNCIAKINDGRVFSAKKYDLDIWSEIQDYMSEHPGVHSQWIRARAGNLGNELADTAARKNRNRPLRPH
jgi:ribonuclease HI